MAVIDPNAHYVKFFRGSLSAWERLLLTPQRIDNDTLYFVYESAEHSDEGKLYLGQKLISGVGEGSGSSNININDIGDIYIDDSTIADKQLLVYNDTTERWENADLADIINTAVSVFSGASALSDGSAGLVPAPSRGDQDKFLRGNGAWATISLPSFDPNVFSVNNNNVVNIIGFTEAAVGTLPIKTNSGSIEWAAIGAGNISRQIISQTDLDDLIEAGTASESIIYMVPIDDPVDTGDRYEEFLIISGHQEKIGTIGDVNLNDYVTTSVFQTAVDDLNHVLYGTTSGGTTTPGLISRMEFFEDKVGDLNSLIFTSGNTTLVDEINTINTNISDLSGRLQWQELQEAQP